MIDNMVYYPAVKGEHPKHQEDFRKIYFIDDQPLPERIKCTRLQYDTVIGLIRQYVGVNSHIEAEMPTYFELQK